MNDGLDEGNRELGGGVWASNLLDAKKFGMALLEEFSTGSAVFSGTAGVVVLGSRSTGGEGERDFGLGMAAGASVGAGKGVTGSPGTDELNENGRAVIGGSLAFASSPIGGLAF